MLDLGVELTLCVYLSKSRSVAESIRQIIGSVRDKVDVKTILYLHIVTHVAFGGEGTWTCREVVMGGTEL